MMKFHRKLSCARLVAVAMPFLLAAALDSQAQTTDASSASSANDAASQAVQEAVETIKGTPTLPSGGTVKLNTPRKTHVVIEGCGGGEYECVATSAANSTFELTVEIPFILDWDTYLIANLKELRAPLGTACAKIGGTASWRSAVDQPSLASKELKSYRVAVRSAESQHLLGQSTCNVNGEPAFIYLALAASASENRYLPPGSYMYAFLMVVDPKITTESIAPILAEARAFAASANELRLNGKGGAEVQVANKGLPQARGNARDWTCGLLVERKDALFQVQIGSQLVFVPSSYVVPKVTFGTYRPGWPKPCAG